MKRPVLLIILLLFVIWLPGKINAQQTARITSGGTGYLEHLPPDYATNTSAQYPVLIFLHGTGETGTGSPSDLNKVKVNGPPKLIEQGHNMCFTVNGKQECFIVISPQLRSGVGGWWPANLTEIFDYVLNGNQNYRIDRNRVYLTGLSMGGQGVYIGLGETQDIFAAGAVIAGYNNGNGCKISERKIPVWGFHGLVDATIPYATGLTEFSRIGWCTNPNPMAELKWTAYEGVGHNAWDKAYSADHSVQSPNLYEWLLTKTKNKVNNPPIANAGVDVAIKLPVNTTSLSGSGTDSDGSIASYEWTKISGPNATLNGVNNATLNLSNLVQGSYVFRLTVYDDIGARAFDEVNVTVNSVNLPPIASAGVDVTIKLPVNTASLSGSGTDSDGSVASYGWTKISGPNATLNGTTIATLNLSNLVQGSYVFRLTVSDDKGASAFDEVNVVVKVANLPPIANAGPDALITLSSGTTAAVTGLNKSNTAQSDVIILVGNGIDFDGEITSYSWTQQNGTPLILTNTDTPNLSISGLVAGIYTFRLTVSDNEGSIGTDDVEVIVNTPTQINLALNKPTSVSSIENSSLLGSSATDGNSSTRWSSSFNDPQWISVDLGDTYEIKEINITWETAYAADYLVQISVDGQTWLTAKEITNNTSKSNTLDILNSTGRYVKIYGTRRATNYGYSIFELEVYGDSISILPNLPPTANAGVDKIINLPVESVVLSGSGSDEDGSIASYLWSQVNGQSMTLINGNTSQLSISNFTPGIYTFRLTVTDNGGLIGSDDVILTINEAIEVNLALNKPTVASSVEYAALGTSWAVDGNNSTRWSSSFNDTNWIYVDLGASYQINRIKILWEAAMAADYKLQLSDDASSWTTINTITDNYSRINEHTNLNYTARYVRILGTRRRTQYGYSIYELEVFGIDTKGNISGRQISKYDLTKEADSKETSISFFPIPFADYLFVDGADNGSYVVRNASGITVLQGIFSGTSIDTSQLAQGIYLIDLVQDNQIIRKKIVK